MDNLTLETPFLETPISSSERLEEAHLEVDHELETPWVASETPFLRDEFENQGLRNDEVEVIAELLADLRDESFNESVYRLAGAANNFLGDRFSGEFGEAEAQSAEAERQLEQFFSPLIQESERMYDRLAEGLERFELSEARQVDLEAQLNQYFPVATNLQPEFEDFLGRLFNKATSFVKNVATKGIALARQGISALGRYGLRPIFEKLKSFVKPIIRRVIQFALNKLPAGVRPIAQRLAQRLLGSVAQEAETKAPLSQT